MLLTLLERAAAMMKATLLNKHKVQGHMGFLAQLKHYSLSQLQEQYQYGANMSQSRLLPCSTEEGLQFK